MQMCSHSPTARWKHSSHSKPLCRRAYTRGFTFVEIIVVLAIVGIMSTVIIAQYRNFESSTILRNLAYDVALTIREAQVLAISTSNINSGNTYAGGGQNSYGVHFDLGVNVDRYKLFVDIDGNNTYSGASELVKEVTINNGAKLETIGAYDSDGAPLGFYDYSNTTMSITFDRPHLETTFYSGTHGVVDDIAEVSLTLSAARGGTPQEIRIARSGRIFLPNKPY
jgi:prepilin-type N-terminal cleavage/methylation domain-containing protein